MSKFISLSICMLFLGISFKKIVKEETEASNRIYWGFIAIAQVICIVIGMFNRWDWLISCLSSM